MSDLNLDDSHVPARERLSLRERPPRTGPDLEEEEWDSYLPLAGGESGVMPLSDVSSPASLGPAGSVLSETVESQAILQKVLAELKVFDLSISEFDKRRVVELVRRNLSAFAVSPSDIGRTHLVTHRIDTGENPPFKERLGPVPHAWREFLEQELDRLLSVGAISEADPGECPYASRCVIVRKRE